LFSREGFARRGRLPTWALGGILSLIVLAAWAIFLQFAPPPESLAPASPAPVQEAAAPAAADASAVTAHDLRLLLWRDVIPAETISGFEAESGLKVAVERFETLEQLDTKVGANALAADIVVVSGAGVKRLVAADLLAPLPPLAAAPSLDPAITARTGVYDPGNSHAAVVQWGTMGLAFDAAKVGEALGSADIDSWRTLFDPEAMAKLASCGVQVVDSPAGPFPIALLHLGRPADSASAEDTSRAWEAVRGSVGKFATAAVVDALAEGKVCFALATSGDAYQARRKVQSAGAGPDIRYVAPKDGTIVWYALVAVPKASANATAAAKFADYLLRADVAARLSNAQGLANAVPSSMSAFKADLRENAMLMPPPAAFAAFTAEMEPSAAAAALRKQFWQLISTPPAPAPASPTP
jgi:putrescine transport system substrate-binding protein